MLSALSKSLFGSGLRSRLIFGATTMSLHSTTANHPSNDSKHTNDLDDKINRASQTNQSTAEQQKDDSVDLVQVVYVTRHGFRTPLSSSNITTRELPWECLSKEETDEIFAERVELHRAVDGEDARVRLPPGPFPPEFPGDQEVGFGKNCNSGQLTLLGHQQMNSVGKKVHKRYVEQLKLLPKEWNEANVSVRSTNSARTIETALEIISGLYPIRGSKPLRVELHSLASETMYPHSSCGFLGGAFKAYRNSDSRASIKQELHSMLNVEDFGSQEHYDFWTKRSLPALCNTLSSLTGHGFPLPQGFKPEHVDKVCDLSGKEYDFLYSNKKIAKLAIGRFLGEITDVLQNKIGYDTTENGGEQLMGISGASEPGPAKFVLMSGHDNTIAPLIKSLELSSGIHPPMSSGLAFELYRDKPKSQDDSVPNYFVKLVYNFQELPIPACGNKVLCPFDDFVKIASSQTPSNYHSECDNEERKYQF